MFPGATVAQVDDVQRSLHDLVQVLRPGDVPLDEVNAMFDAFARIERQAAAAKTLLAARLDESRSWVRAGARGVDDHIARLSGTSRAAAKRTLATSRRLASLPATEQAVRRGELSADQADTIADAAAVNPGAETSLLDTARRSNLVELRERANRAKAAGDPDPGETHARIRRTRCLHRYTDGEGAWNLRARGTVDAGAAFNGALDPIIDELFHEARRQGRRDARETYAFDALLLLARRATGRDHDDSADGAPDAGDESTDDSAASDHERDVALPVGHGATDVPATTAPAGTRTPATLPSPGDSSRPVNAPPAGGGDGPGAAHRALASPRSRGRRRPPPTYQALLRVDVAALRRGRVEGDEVCEIAGVGAVPATVARGLLGDAVLKLVVTRGVDVVNVTHLGRGPTAAQRVALLWTSPACTNESCSNRLAIEHDHRRPWAADRVTELGNLDRLCRPCHRRKTHDGWALVAGRGRRALVPPGDPRHPGSRDRAAATRSDADAA